MSFMNKVKNFFYEDVEEDVSATLKISIGGKSVSYWESGYVFIDNFTVEELDKDDEEEGENDKDKIIEDKIDEDNDDEGKEKDKDKEKQKINNESENQKETKDLF